MKNEITFTRTIETSIPVTDELIYDTVTNIIEDMFSDNGEHGRYTALGYLINTAVYKIEDNPTEDEVEEWFNLIEKSISEEQEKEIRALLFKEFMVQMEEIWQEDFEN